MTSQFQSVSAAFSKQAPSFDSIEEQNEILKWMRTQIHAHCMRHFKRGDQILELNCGTGIDAVYFAEHGMHVLATDLAEGMLQTLRKKTDAKSFPGSIAIKQCSFTSLSELNGKKFDHIFSDFGGLNCVEDIESVIHSFRPLLHPNGTVTLVIMPRICPWELLLAIKGNFKTAFRRLKRKGALSHLEGETFTSYYFSVQRIVSAFGNEYRKAELQGLGCFVPPPYLETFPQKHEKFFEWLKKLDEKSGHTFPFNHWSDHFILTMKLK